MRVSVHDVAKYILKKQGSMTAMKLQKLVYYCQAWSLVWDEKPLFKENIEAWANGPVVRKLYEAHRGKFKVDSWRIGKISNLSQSQKATIDSVLKFYGKKTSQWLSELTHKERPWKEARKGLAPSDRGCTIIKHASMAEYYESLI
ncbi:MAG: type II toxin-antitoxin system antitoxin SocA domain-containing protein [Nitrospinota bacterium]